MAQHNHMECRFYEDKKNGTERVRWIQAVDLGKKEFCQEQGSSRGLGWAQTVPGMMKILERMKLRLVE